MRSCVRFSFLALLVGVIVAAAAPAAQAAFGIERFFASNCNAAGEKCGEGKNPSLTEAKEQGFTQAAGHPNFGVTDFTVNNHVVQTVPFTAVAPDGLVTHVRTDVGPGVSTNPEAVPKCSFAEYGTEATTGFFLAPTCKPETEIGVNKVVVLVKTEGGVFVNVPIEGNVYNLVQPKGLASDFGVALKLPLSLTEGIFKGTPLEKTQLYAHTLIEGNVEWGAQAAGTGKADYHDYFEINVSPTLPLISSRLNFKGNIGTLGKGGFLTNPTSCTGTGPQTTTTLTLTPKEGPAVKGAYTTLLGTENCNLVPFAPGFELSPETSKQDESDGISTRIELPHDPSPIKLDSSDVRTATVTLPEGMTLNPSAAAQLEACKPSQARITSEEAGTSCPEGSKIGTATLEVPGLPASEPLQGSVYLGGPESGPITEQPYTMYLDAESPRYGVSVRVKGTVAGNESTGRVTAQFAENPEQPFSNLTLHFKGGTLAPIANPLGCGTATTNATFDPFSGTGLFSPPVTPFTVDSDGKGGACASPVPFSLSQSTSNASPNAGGHTNYTFSLTRPSANQYISQVQTTLPPGLVGAIPIAKQCPEVAANAGTCSAESEIGQASAIAGAGPTPFSFTGGHVYLTGPYNGAPFGMSIVVPATAGPFSLGNVVTRATININPYTDRVIVTSVLPRVFKGVALRVRGFTVAINKQGFLFNPTNCGAFNTESVLTGFVPGSSAASTQSLASPFQVGKCNALKFKPSFKAATSSRTSKANGASLETTINYVPGQANIKAVKVQLPRALPSRLTTLQKACTEAQFAANPYHCPSGSFVGGARANTPVLPSKLTGPAILVSHGGAAFPDLDLLLEANGVRTIVVGNTDIKKGITTTTFASTPDVPVSSVTVNLPIGSHSALTANTNLCANPLVMPTTLTGQNGVSVKQNTRIAVRGCGVRIVGRKVVGNTAYITVQTFAAGRISGKGGGLATVFRRLGSAQQRATLKVPLTRGGRNRRRPFNVRLRVGFVPKARGGQSSVSFATLSFR
jgi:hypothetical protein